MAADLPLSVRFATAMQAAIDAAREDPRLMRAAGLTSLPPISLAPVPAAARKRTRPSRAKYASAEERSAAIAESNRRRRKPGPRTYPSGRLSRARQVPAPTVVTPAYNTNYDRKPDIVTPRGDTFRTYVFESDELSVENIRRLLAALPESERAFKTKVVSKGPIGKSFGSSMMDSHEALVESVAEFLRQHARTYEDEEIELESAVLHDESISIIVAEKNSEVGLGAARSIAEAGRKWYVHLRETRTNCLYQAVQVCKYPESFELYQRDNAKLVEHARKLKLRLDPENKRFSNNQTISSLSTYLKCNILLYDNIFKLQRVFEPELKVGQVPKRSRPDKLVKRRALEIQIRDNHFVPLLRYADIGKVAPTEAELAESAAELVAGGKAAAPSEAKMIRKLPNLYIKEDFDSKFAAWDIETSQNGTEDGSHKCYAAGIAWYEGGQQKYECFWGLDALSRFMDFLHAEQQRFDGYTLYAHNGGKFDLPILMREALAGDTRWRIAPRSLIEVNGRWVNMSIESGDVGSKLTFKDSIALMPEGLGKLCKDFKVPHQKLAETVSHKDITIQNWNSYPALPLYLEHDCRGLLEVMDKFARDVYESSTIDFKVRAEEVCREAFSHHTGRKFMANVRPSWLGRKAGPLVSDGAGDKCPKKALELDGYCEELSMAFEWQGAQHYERVPFFHPNDGDFERQVRYDARKKDLCEAKGVKLHIIDGRFFPREEAERQAAIGAHVKALLGRAVAEKRKFSMRARRGGINVTSCVSGANLSKKWFYSSSYNQLRNPIYTLTEEQDTYIRKGYYGGRVEIFRIGRVDGKLYYYDFTSLYPAMGIHDLPYGDPRFEADLSAGLPADFFGFVRCRVRSLDFKRKPLHAYMDKKGSKLLFPYLKEWTELDLFSEEARRGMEEGMYEYQFLDGYAFKRAPLMKGFFEEIFAKKATATKAMMKALAKVFKIVLNSGYGFWGLRTRDRDGIQVYSKGDDAADFYKYLDEGKLVSYGEHEQYTILRMLKDLPTTDFNVGVASAITSWARMRLWSLIKDIEAKPGCEVVMCDTDSVVTTCKLNDYPDLMDEYMWDGCGEELGSLKNEADDLMADAVKPEVKAAAPVDSTSEQVDDMVKERVAELAKLEGGMLGFDGGGYLGGCKFYALRKQTAGHTMEIAKCKGVSKGQLCFDDFLVLDAAYKAGVVGMRREQEQWLCGMGNYVSETAEDFCAIRVRNITKKINFFYDKGQIRTDGSIVPLVL